MPQVTLDAQHGTGAAGACVHATPANIEAIRGCITRLITADSLNDAFFVVVMLCFLTLLVAAFLGQDPALKAERGTGEEAPEMVPVEA